MTDRGVSEVIAFILVFSIVITSVGLLYTVGFGSLDRIQETEQDRSAERAFSAVAVAFEDIQTDRASNRGAGVELSGRSLTVNDSEMIAVDVGSDGTSDVEFGGALVYGSFEDTEIVYQSGAVLRVQGEDAQLVSRGPRFRCNNDHAVISGMEVQDPMNRSFSSDGQVTIVAQQRNPDAGSLVPTDRSATSVTVTYDGGKYDAAWDRYFEKQGWSETTDGWECSGATDGVYVRKTVVDLQFYF